MPNKPKRTLLLILLVLLTVLTTPFFGEMKTPLLSAYGACRTSAMLTKGYDVWHYQGGSADSIFMHEFYFDDGTNTLFCFAVGVGPFWIAPWPGHTIVARLGKEDYYGVSP